MWSPEELTHRLDVGVADDDGAPAVFRVGDIVDEGSEYAPRQVDATLR